MKTSVSSILLIAITAVAPLATINAETFFKSDFDGESYADNLPLVTGPGKIEFGQWGLNNKGEGTATVSTVVALSPSRSLALTVKSEGDLAQVIAFPGVDSQKVPVSQAIVVKVAFNLPDLTRPVNMVIRDPGGHNLAQFKIEEGGAAKAIFADLTPTLGLISPATWYYAAFTMPAHPGEGTTPYKAVLYAGDGITEIGSALGSLCSQPSSGEYSYFSVFVEGAANQSEPVTAYFDDFSIESMP